MSTPSDGNSVLKLADPAGKAPKGNAALGISSDVDKVAEQMQLAENQARIQELEKSNAKLEHAIRQGGQQRSKSRTANSGKARHVAHADGWTAIATEPDYCKVGKDVIAFNSFANLDTKVTASPNVKARGTAVYRKGDVIKSVKGDAGKHIVSGTSLGSGHVKILEGHENVKVNGIPTARHDSRCMINCDASGVGGAQGKLVTEQKAITSSGSAAPVSEAPAGQRTSDKLQKLMAAREKIASGMLDFNAMDQFVSFKEANQALGEWIAKLSGAHGSAADAAAQVTRGLLGFAKDFSMGAGELFYEGMKAVPKVIRLTETQSGQFLTQLDGHILAENIRLGNVSAETVAHTALDIGKAVVKPVTDPWGKKQYVEAVIRGAAEVFTFGWGLLKGRKAAKAAKDATLAKESALTDSSAPTTKSLGSTAAGVDDGIHVRKAKKPKFSGKWKNYHTHGIKANPMASAEGRRMVLEFEKQGLDREDAIFRAKDLMKTGASLPMANPIEVGDKFLKLVTEGESIGSASAFWITEKEAVGLTGLTYDQIADRLGIPLASQQGTTFQVFEVTALRPGTSFTSVIAGTTEIGEAGVTWSQLGGEIQTLLTDRSIFTNPRATTMKFP